MVSFSNATIKERTPGKPHLVFVGGWWRVSKWERETADLYERAHKYIAQMNGSASCEKAGN